jgi:glutamate synthase domain-containing protein 2
MRNEFIVFVLITLIGTALLGYFIHPNWYYLFLFFGPINALGIYDMYQDKHAIMRNYPILGRGRYVMEDLRPKLYQYFIESDTDGTPIPRIHRSLIYQRAKDVLDTSPFGTQLNVYEEGYEWMSHSIAALDAHELEQSPRIKVASDYCKQPYEASIFNISAMSYGSLSKNAIAALNGGAASGGFAHNTGEGGISPYHEKHQGDLIYQVGTGYFGSRADDGNFSPEKFQKMAAKSNVKMIELKLSQGAKPGHGGILPGKKNTAEIAEIRGVEQGTDVLSPPFHKAFNTPKGLLQFIRQMQDLSGGKPVGFKLCIGQRSEFIAVCKAMLETKIYPDFISVDGAEGGTGAAPLEFSDSVGMPFQEALAFASDVLVGFGLKDHIRLFCAGKVFTGFHIFRAMALGADACYSARGMMLALGCIQSLLCNTNHCPTGVATQDPERVADLVVSDKKFRVANYHYETLKSLVELLAAAGLKSPEDITREHVYRRISMHQIKTYEELFPSVESGCMLDLLTVPVAYRNAWKQANADHF